MSLQRYAKLLPDSYHYLSASCFSIFNHPEIVPGIFKAAQKELLAGIERKDVNLSTEERLTLARQFREALLRAGIFGGMSKAINSLQELHKSMPDNLKDTPDGEGNPPEELVGDSTRFLKQGREFLAAVYGHDQGLNIEKALYGLSPRLGHYSVPLVYGSIYADTSALSIRQACVLMFLCNMAVDTPKQAIGHIDSSRRQGSSKEELLNVGIMVRTIAEMYGIKLQHWESIMEAVDSGEVSGKNPYEI